MGLKCFKVGLYSQTNSNPLLLPRKYYASTQEEDAAADPGGDLLCALPRDTVIEPTTADQNAENEFDIIGQAEDALIHTEKERERLYPAPSGDASVDIKWRLHMMMIIIIKLKMSTLCI